MPILPFLGCRHVDLTTPRIGRITSHKSQTQANLGQQQGGLCGWTEGGAALRGGAPSVVIGAGLGPPSVGDGDCCAACMSDRRKARIGRIGWRRAVIAFWEAVALALGLAL